MRIAINDQKLAVFSKLNEPIIIKDGYGTELKIFVAGGILHFNIEEAGRMYALNRHENKIVEVGP